MPSIERPEPPYMQIAAEIRARIASGDLKVGDAVPSARQITRDWEVAMATAAKALALLGSEGLVRSVSGVGTIVAGDSLHLSAQDRVLAIERTGKIYPPGHYAKVRSAVLTAAPAEVAGALGLDEGEQVIQRRRTTYSAEDVALSTSVSWYPGDLAEVAPLLLETSRIPQGTSRYVEELTGRVVNATHVQHAGGGASAEDAQELGVEASTPVLLSRNRFLDAAGAVIEYGESTTLPGHWVFYEYTNGGGA
ncbi:DNA-binding GntR family transcriptional regulator [Actinokineospora baliensis]|uniref:GntR family transcriptional regulator n=1 Tax=Actinokineospora baliensis TaxID=547056 RepID=UPI00195C1CEA|nr:GntR family transcriptional regulator [Actinokineospora baliensis]MBM7771888.1 DNA-binding GntR family transcriptional regulator [Actinokineospora baliensis]